MIKKLLDKIINTPKPEKVVCEIDEEIVDCVEMDTPTYIGYPAPPYLQDDPWFGPAPNLSEKQIDYMEKETQIKIQEGKLKMCPETGQYVPTTQSENIHQKMYEIATKNWTTVSESLGGSENFQEGPGGLNGWQSGTGLRQFRNEQ